MKVVATLAASAIGAGLVVNGAFAGRGGGTVTCGGGGGGGYAAIAGYGGGGGGGGGGGSNCPAPQVRQSFNVVPRGSVLIRTPGGQFVPLGSESQVPMGSTLDTRNGSVTLTSASNSGGATQTGVFSAGIFQVKQTKGKKPFTVLALRGGLTQAGASTAGAQSAARRRRLFGNARGRFRTRGRHGAATVRGTRWLTEDRPLGTFFSVQAGTVFVRDFRKKRTLKLEKGDKYFAKSG